MPSHLVLHELHAPLAFKWEFLSLLVWRRFKLVVLALKSLERIVRRALVLLRKDDFAYQRGPHCKRRKHSQLSRRAVVGLVRQAVWVRVPCFFEVQSF